MAKLDARFTEMMRQVHDACTGPERWRFSEPSLVTNEVKRDCVLALTLFSVMFLVMLTDALQNCDDGHLIRYRLDDKLFNLRRLQAK